MRLSAADRFWSKVAEDGDCWLWTGAGDRYGRFAADGRQLVMAHRWSYEQMVSDIPTGLTLDHLCRRTKCVNPYHLDPVPIAENIRRAQRVITECPAAHTLSGDNLYEYRGRRECKTCRRDRNREWARNARTTSV